MAFTKKFGTPDINEAQAKLKKLQSARVKLWECKDTIKAQHEIINEQYENLKKDELIADWFKQEQFKEEFKDHEHMLEKMLDPSIDK